MHLLRLRAANTHLYPGARLAASDPPITPKRGDHVVVEFADLGIARGRIVALGAGGRLQLGLASHRTQRGTTIPAKRWTLEPFGTGTAPGYRIVGRATPG